MKYPFTRKVDVVDDFHGTKVPDPYRWLEVTDSPGVKEWVSAQNKITDEYFTANPVFPAIRQRLSQLMTYALRSVPIKAGDYYYFTERPSPDKHTILYRSKTIYRPDEIVFDPSTLGRNDITHLPNYNNYSPNGNYLCYAVITRGGDWLEYRIKDLSTLRDLDEVITGSTVHCGNIRWDGEHTFYYWRYTSVNPETLKPEYKHTKIYRHELGTSVDSDVLVYEYPQEPETKTYLYDNSSPEYLVILHWNSNKTDPRKILVRPIGSKGDFIEITAGKDSSFLHNKGNSFYFCTAEGAPNGRVVIIDLDRPQPEHWRTIIPEQTGEIDVSFLKAGYFLVHLNEGLRKHCFLHNMDGILVDEIKFPTEGMLLNHSEIIDNTIYFQFTSYLYPDSILRYSIDVRTLTQSWRPAIDFEFNNYVTEVVYFPSRDGTEIPMYVTASKDTPRSGDNPVMLEGYGSAGSTIRPNFQARLLPWLEQGGIHAWACIRGGGEFGDEWHDAGKLEKKQNTFDDFAAAAEWLIADGYTRPARLAIAGQSWGGTLVATVMEQQPELFGAVVCQMPLLDMLRHQKSGVGGFWVGEFGDPENEPAHFALLSVYSPVHNVKESAKYPPILITCGENDQRVPPLHAFKFTAALQATDPNNAILLRIEHGAGHTTGTSNERRIDAMSEVLSFLFSTLKITFSSKE